MKTLLSFLVGVLGMADLAAIELDEIAHQVKVTAVAVDIAINPFLEDEGETKVSALVNEVQKLGAPAIPYLLPLLQHKNKHVRVLVMSILADIEGLKEKHLDALMNSGLDESRRSLSNAFARIGTPRSIGVLMEMFKKDEVGAENFKYAFKLLGAKGVPYIIDLFREESADETVLRNAQYLLNNLGGEAELAVDPLIEIISDKNSPKANRHFAILALGSFAEKSHASVPLLQKLAAEDPVSFESAVESAIVRMEAPEALGILVKQLHEEPDILGFRAIAELRGNGKSVGRELLPYLNHKDWDVRIGAAKTLGYIDYDLASPSLIKLLENKNDWRLVYVAAESLGRIGAKNSVPALTKIALNHWYPPVRDVAKEVVAVIRSNSAYESENASSNFSIDFFDFEHAGRELEKPSIIESERQSDKDSARAKGSLNEEELKNFFYEVEIYSYGHEGKIMRKRKQIPGAGIKVGNGHIVGASRGEWGGELVFIDKQGKSSKIINDNIQGIYHTASGIVVVAGLAHLSYNRGLLYRVSKGEDGDWHAVKWKALPGAPKFSSLRVDGSLFIGSLCGSIVFNPDGSIQWLPVSGVSEASQE